MVDHRILVAALVFAAISCNGSAPSREETLMRLSLAEPSAIGVHSPRDQVGLYLELTSLVHPSPDDLAAAPEVVSSALRAIPEAKTDRDRYLLLLLFSRADASGTLDVRDEETRAAIEEGARSIAHPTVRRLGEDLLDEMRLGRASAPEGVE